MKTFETFNWQDEDHQIGYEACESCWNYPSKCDECEEGLVHTAFGDEWYDAESGDDGYWLYYQCDSCENTSP